MPNDDGDYNCPDFDYDSKDVDEEGSLKNVLLITGPVGVCGIISVTTVMYTRLDGSITILELNSLNLLPSKDHLIEISVYYIHLLFK
jgi:hypothetical protein